MASLFSSFRSKKTSEYGVWVDDEALTNCMVCDTPFTLAQRKHHCRNCGASACGNCTKNTMFLESSRSGQPKRICDWCYFQDRLWDETDDDTVKPEDCADPARPHIIQQVSKAALVIALIPTSGCLIRRIKRLHLCPPYLTLVQQAHVGAPT